MSDTTVTHISDSHDPVPALVDVYHAIDLAGRLDLLAVSAETAWEQLISALNEESEDGYTFALDSTATVPYDIPRPAVDAYVEELIREIPFTDDVVIEHQTPTPADHIATEAEHARTA